jgi:hypothetical protein
MLLKARTTRADFSISPPPVEPVIHVIQKQPTPGFQRELAFSQARSCNAPVTHV